MAKYSQISKFTITDLENCGVQIQADSLDKFAEYFGISIDTLVGRTNFSSDLDKLDSLLEICKTLPEIKKRAIINVLRLQLQVLKVEIK